MNIWLMRTKPELPNYIWAKSVQEAQELMLKNEIQYMVLEYDLGRPRCGGKPCEVLGNYFCVIECKCDCHKPYDTGYNMLAWMFRENHWPAKRPMIYGNHKFAAMAMERLINFYGRYSIDANPEADHEDEAAKA